MTLRRLPACVLRWGVVDQGLADGIRERGVVVLCGAGISVAAPSSLPSWWDFNKGVLQALGDRVVRDTSAEWAKGRLAGIVERRESLQSFTPDFMAQLMAEEVGPEYFRVLQALDAEQWNANHAALAALAGAGLVRAIVTTNFDRLLERALDAAGVTYGVHATAAGFEVLGAGDHEELPVVKAHGTVEDAESMVDTLAQRVAGRPQALEEAIVALLRRFPCLVLGFSGADLAYDPEYLGLRPAADGAAGMTVLTLPGAEPRPPMRRLLEAWGERARVIEGALPEWLVQLAADMDVAVAGPDPAPPERPWDERLAERTAAWVESLGTVSAVNMFTALADTNVDDDEMLRYLMFYRRYYRSTEDALRPEYWRFEYNLGRRLLDRGLIGTIDAHGSGVVPDWQNDVEAAAYVDATQFLARAADQGDLPEGHADVVRLLALKFGHGRVRGNVENLVRRYFSDRTERANYEIALLAAEFAEELGSYDDGILFCRVAVSVAAALGDEPRRGSALARGARLVGLKGDRDAGRRLAGQALEIAVDLSLPVLEGDSLAARGMVDVLDSRDADAVEPLARACTIFRRTQRRPRLLYALCDHARAAYYAGDVDAANSGLDEAFGLAGALPGLCVQALQAQVEILEDSGQLDGARRTVSELAEVAEKLQHDAGIRRARRILERLDQAGTEPQ